MGIDASFLSASLLRTFRELQNNVRRIMGVQLSCIKPDDGRSAAEISALAYLQPSKVHITQRLGSLFGCNYKQVADCKDRQSIAMTNFAVLLPGVWIWNVYTRITLRR